MMQLRKDLAVIASSILQRNPVVMRPLSAIEKEYELYRESLEEERSRGPFNIQKPGSDGNAAGSSITTVAVPSLEAELNETLPPTNLHRHLHRKLYFSLRDKLTGRWILPGAAVMPSDELPVDGLHTLAQRSLAALFAPSIGLQFYHVGAAPVAVFSEAFAERVEPPRAAKHFFFRSHLVAGRVRLQDCPEHGWFLKEELKDLMDAKYLSAISPILTE